MYLFSRPSIWQKSPVVGAPNPSASTPIEHTKYKARGLHLFPLSSPRSSSHIGHTTIHFRGIHQNFPVLPFLVSWRKARKNTPKTRIFYPYRTPKILGKEAKTQKKNNGNSSARKFLKMKKTRTSKKKGKKGQVWGKHKD